MLTTISNEQDFKILLDYYKSGSKQEKPFLVTSESLMELNLKDLGISIALVPELCNNEISLNKVRLSREQVQALNLHGRINFKNIIIDKQDLSPISIEDLELGIGGENILSEFVINGADFAGAQFISCNLTGAKFIECFTESALFISCEGEKIKSWHDDDLPQEKTIFEIAVFKALYHIVANIFGDRVQKQAKPIAVKTPIEPAQPDLSAPKTLDHEQPPEYASAIPTQDAQEYQQPK